MFDIFKKKPANQPPERFPPVPAWRPSIAQPLDRIAERMQYYTDKSKDLALFQYGTCVVLPDGLSDADAARYAREVLTSIFNAHPDVNPVSMDDGNILVRYNHPAVNVVFEDIVLANWAEIDRRHQDALATHEVLITPLGSNRFDDFGKKILFGRCFMFMDAQDPQVVRVVRKPSD